MEVMGRYQLTRRLAAGGMAEVFLARTVGPAEFSKVCVVKRILPHLASNEEFITLFLNEARISAQLAHPNVVQFFDMGHERGQYFLAMEYVDGPTLRGLIQSAGLRGERIPIPVALKITSLALEGLAYAHAFADERGRPLNLVHRDISPHNIMLSRSGAVKVGDFGIAKAASLPSVTKTGQVRGKLRYMSPEQLTDEPLDGRSDLFAMGITLFEMLTGVRPYGAENDAEAIKGILGEPAPRLAQFIPGATDALQAILDRALEKDRNARYPTASAMQKDIEALLMRLGAVVRGAELAALIEKSAPRQSEPSTVSEERPKLPGEDAPARPVSGDRKLSQVAVAMAKAPAAELESRRRTREGASVPAAALDLTPPATQVEPLPAGRGRDPDITAPTGEPGPSQPTAVAQLEGRRATREAQITAPEVDSPPPTRSTTAPEPRRRTRDGLPPPVEDSAPITQAEALAEPDLQTDRMNAVRVRAPAAAEPAGSMRWVILGGAVGLVVVAALAWLVIGRS